MEKHIHTNIHTTRDKERNSKESSDHDHDELLLYTVVFGILIPHIQRIEIDPDAFSRWSIFSTNVEFHNYTVNIDILHYKRRIIVGVFC